MVDDHHFSERYVDDLLQITLLFSLDGLLHILFQQDNWRPHITRWTMDCFQEADVNVLPWLSRSPDLNPIERVWGIWKRFYPFCTILLWWTLAHFIHEVQVICKEVLQAFCLCLGVYRTRSIVSITGVVKHIIILFSYYMFTKFLANFFVNTKL